MSNRRQFITATAGGTALASLSAPAFAAVQTRAARRLGGSPTMAAFQGLQGQSFKVRAGAGKASSLHLQAVKPGALSPRTEQFTLVLRAEGPQAIEGGVYQLEHAQTGRFHLRLEPSGRHAQGPLYRADLSLLV